MRMFGHEVFARFALGFCTENESKDEVEKTVTLKPKKRHA